jgi:hypothetical protein
MPYYVFRVLPFVPPQKLAEFPAFADASQHAKALRAAQGAGDSARVKVMFAERQEHAEDLLCQPRDRGPAGDD